MKKYDVLLWDLDGTIIDSGEGVINSVIHSLKKYGIEVEDRNELKKFIGPPLYDSYEKYFGFSKEEAIKAVEYYREYYSVKGITEHFVYDGIPQLLRELSESGYRLTVATSKPEFFARQILESDGIADCFEYIAGANFDESRTRKDEVIRYALETCNVTDNSRVLMIGDRHFDVDGAKKENMDCLGVLFGYGDRKELEEAGATYICATVSDMKKLLLGK